MCRRNQLIGLFLVGVGVGAIAACKISSLFWCISLGLAVILVGVFVLQKGRV